MVGPAAKRAAVAHLQAVMSLSERRACSIVGADRKMIRYRSSRPADAALRGRLRDLANERRRFGYRRLFVLLRREGEPSGINRIYRLYREEGLTVRKRRARRKAVGTRVLILVKARPNARWLLAVSAHPGGGQTGRAIALRPLHHRGHRNAKPPRHRPAALATNHGLNDALSQIIRKKSAHQMLAPKLQQAS
jgi:transposase InsO family protein